MVASTSGPATQGASLGLIGIDYVGRNAPHLPPVSDHFLYHFANRQDLNLSAGHCVQKYMSNSRVGTFIAAANVGRCDVNNLKCRNRRYTDFVADDQVNAPGLLLFPIKVPCDAGATKLELDDA